MPVGADVNLELKCTTTHETTQMTGHQDIWKNEQNTMKLKLELIYLLTCSRCLPILNDNHRLIWLHFIL